MRIALLLVALTTFACGDRVGSSSGVRGYENEWFVSAALLQLANHRVSDPTDLLDDVMREMVVYLCAATGQMATNLREASLDEILDLGAIRATVRIRCGAQELEDGRVAHGRYLVGRMWVGPALQPGRKAPRFRGLTQPLRLPDLDHVPPGNWE